MGNPDRARHLLIRYAGLFAAVLAGAGLARATNDWSWAVSLGLWLALCFRFSR